MVISKKRNRFFGLLMAAALLVSCSGNSPKSLPRHHALIIMARWDSAQKGINLVKPYDVNLLALGLLRNRGRTKPGETGTVSFNIIVQQCQGYIQWYLNHLNMANTFGLSGTISHYEVSGDGTERQLNDFSPIDGTAASFILLLHRFYKATGYRQMIVQSRGKIEDIAYLIPYLQDRTDGLTSTLPAGSKRKFLANNCLGYAAMDAIIDLSTELGWEGKTDFYKNARAALKNGISTHFYRKDTGGFYWLIENKENQPQPQLYAADPDTFYPDGYAQLFPLLFKLLPESGNRLKRLLWKKISGLHGKTIAEQNALHRIIYYRTEMVMQGGPGI
ncbi:MAG: hypothetical protein GY940_31540 [bacterium]|nr:hypothetical protein [bacterium]